MDNQDIHDEKRHYDETRAIKAIRAAYIPCSADVTQRCIDHELDASDEVNRAYATSLLKDEYQPDQEEIDWWLDAEAYTRDVSLTDRMSDLQDRIAMFRTANIRAMMGVL